MNIALNFRAANLGTNRGNKCEQQMYKKKDKPKTTTKMYKKKTS